MSAADREALAAEMARDAFAKRRSLGQREEGCAAALDATQFAAVFYHVIGLAQPPAVPAVAPAAPAGVPTAARVTGSTQPSTAPDDAASGAPSLPFLLQTLRDVTLVLAKQVSCFCCF